MASNLFRVETGFDIDEEVFILHGADDPSAGAGFEAPPGSIYLRNVSSVDGGQLWLKVGDDDTDWEQSGADVSTELGYIRAFIGKNASGSEMPDYSSNNVVTDSDSLEIAIGDIDAEIGASVVANTRTNNAISDQAINLNITTLDDAIGSDSDMTSVNYIALADNIYTNLSNLDAQVKINEDAISALETGLQWLLPTVAITGDDISAFSGTSVTFSDDLNGITVVANDRVASTFDNKIYVVNAGTWTVASDGNLASGNTFFTKHDFVSTSDATTQGASAFTYNGTNLILIAEFDFESADSIKLTSGYSSVNGTIVTSDTVESALEKLDGNQKDLITLSGVAQGDTDLGTFTGNTITDNVTIKVALQELETQVDINIADITNLEQATGTSTGLVGLTYTEQNYVTDGESLSTSIDELDKAIGNIRTESSDTGVTTEVTLDEVLVDDYDTVKWLVTAIEEGNPNRKTSWEVFAVHDGTPTADATDADFTKYAKLRINGRITGLKVLVDVNGSGATQTMRLRVRSTDSVSLKAIRTAF